MVDRSQNIFPIVTRGAVADGEAARDEVVLDVDDNEGASRLQDFLHPTFPADVELFFVQ